MELYTAYLTYSAYKGDSTEEVYKLVQDARLFGIGILPPDICRGNAHFEMVDEGIAFGLGHIRGVGAAAIEKITGLNAMTIKSWSLTTAANQAVVEIIFSPPGESGGAAAQPEAQSPVACAGSPVNQACAVASIPQHSWPGFVRAATELPRNVAEGLVKAGAVDWTGGLNEQAVEFFLSQFEAYGRTTKTLGFMASAGPNEGAKTLSQMSKSELVGLLKVVDGAEGGYRGAEVDPADFDGGDQGQGMETRQEDGRE